MTVDRAQLCLGGRDDRSAILASCKAKGATMRVERCLLRATEKSRTRIASSSIVT